MEQAREPLALGVMPSHRRLQRFLDVARHIAPHVHRSPSQQIREAFLSVGHLAPPSARV